MLIVSIYFLISKIYSQTTQEEYNYLTKGYKIQFENGLDVKIGYSISDFGNWGLNRGSESRTCVFKGLIRKGQLKLCAILLIYKRNDITDGLNLYICIPRPDAPSEIWKQTFNIIEEYVNDEDSIPLSQTIIWALMKFSSILTQK